MTKKINSYPRVDPSIWAVQSRESEDDKIPVIISCRNLRLLPVTQQHLKDHGCYIKHSLPIINAVSTIVKRSTLETMLKSKHVSYIFLDAQVSGVLDIARTTLHANWANSNHYTGKDVTVAVIDTGIAPHPDLTRPRSRIIGFKDFVNNRLEPYDDEGHGTHVAGIIAGNGHSSGGKYRGIAPEANLVGVKVLNSSSSGTISDVLAGMQWVLNNRKKYQIRIINMSFGAIASQPAHKDPLCLAARKMVNEGLIVVTAAGNSGPDPKTINSPGISASVITVGALDDRVDRMTIPPFSSRGPTAEGLHKPDIIAPGVDITSLNNKGSGYIAMSGTSMATPTVAGALALLVQKQPRLTPAKAKAQLLRSSKRLQYARDAEGNGLLNIKTLLNKKI